MTEIKRITAEEADIPYVGPAVYANRFFVTVGPVVRLAFAEQAGADKMPIFRSAVALSHQDAIELADLLKGLLKDIEKEIQVAMQQAQAAQNVSEA